MKKIIDRKFKKADAILTSDWHLQNSTPVCRLDDFIKTQWAKVSYIKKLQSIHDCPVLHGGDFYNEWNPTIELINTTINKLPKKFYSVYGNHDLPYKNINFMKKCGLNLLDTGGMATTFISGSWGTNPPQFSELEIKGKKILLWHVMTYKNKNPYKNTIDSSLVLLKKNAQFDLIVTGDNHESFTTAYDNRLLVNPGSIFRLEADQIDFKPRVYLWHASNNSVEPVYLPINKSAVTRDHIEKKNKMDSDFSAFIESFNTINNKKTELNFIKFLNKFIIENKIDNDITDIINNALENA